MPARASRDGFALHHQRQRAQLRPVSHLRAILMKMNQLISNEEMAAMNHAVESEKRNEKEVAAEFLRRKGLLP